MKNHRLAIFLNIFLLCFYISIGYLKGDISNVKNTLFSAPDSRSYSRLSDYLYGKSSVGINEIKRRTYFYPILLGVKNIFGNYSVYFMQLVFYILSVNILSQSILIFTKSKLMFLMSFLIFTLNFSLNQLTYRALTEVLSILLSCIFMYLFVRYNFTLKSKITLLLLLVLSILAVTRPNYILHYVFFVLIMLGYFTVKKKGPLLYLAMVLVSSLSIFLQVYLYQSHTNEIGISKIADWTFQAYYFSRVYSEREGMTWEEARKLTANWVAGDRLKYLSREPFTAITIFFKTIIEDNVLGHTSGHKVTILRYVYNIPVLAMHILFGVIFIPYLLRVKRIFDQKLIISIIYMFSLFIIVSSGISFGEGDRLVIPAQPFWEFVYLSMFADIIGSKNLAFFSAKITRYASKYTKLLRN